MMTGFSRQAFEPAKYQPVKRDVNVDVSEETPWQTVADRLDIIGHRDWKIASVKPVSIYRDGPTKRFTVELVIQPTNGSLTGEQITRIVDLARRVAAGV